MAAFTFELLRGGTRGFAETIEVPTETAVWCHVEALALRMGGSPGAVIRVSDDRGEAVVRTGVATALASIEQCPCDSCVVKEAARDGKIFDGALQLSPCRTAGSCACGGIASEDA